MINFTIFVASFVLTLFVNFLKDMAMKKFGNGVFCRAFVSAVLLTMSAFAASVAQVSVNAPKGLSSRSSSAMTSKKTPQAAAPAHTGVTAPAASDHSAKGLRHKNSSTAKPKMSRQGTAVTAKGTMSGTAVVGRYTGYRVQVLFTSAKNGRSLAQRRAKKIALKYPQYRAYMSYVAPRWRLRFGDFKTYAEAKSLARLIKRSFPEMRADVVIVTDKVNKFK